MAGTVAVERAAAPRRKFLDVAAVGRPGKPEPHNLHPVALHWIVVERKHVHVGHEVAFPRTYGEPLVFLKELALRPEAIAKLERISQNEIFVVKKVDYVRSIRSGKKPQRLVRDIEVLVRDVQRDREDRARAPLECLFRIFVEPDGRRAAAFVNVNERFEQMALRFGLASRRDFTKVRIGFLLLAEIQIGTERAHSFPRLDFDLH
jgi:hypothetical protein